MGARGGRELKELIRAELSITMTVASGSASGDVIWPQGSMQVEVFDSYGDCHCHQLGKTVSHVKDLQVVLLS